ncbi:hypothetical protein BH23ACT10_BH23ACT10_33050 [soil metagenome]
MIVPRITPPITNGFLDGTLNSSAPATPNAYAVLSFVVHRLSSSRMTAQNTRPRFNSTCTKSPSENANAPIAPKPSMNISPMKNAMTAAYSACLPVRANRRRCCAVVRCC